MLLFRFLCGTLSVQTEHSLHIGKSGLQLFLLGSCGLVCVMESGFLDGQPLLFVFQGFHGRKFPTAIDFPQRVTGGFVQSELCAVFFVELLRFAGLAIFCVNVSIQVILCITVRPFSMEAGHTRGCRSTRVWGA